MPREGELRGTCSAFHDENMLDQTCNLPQSVSDVLGDVKALAEQLGGSDSLGQLPLAFGSLSCARIGNVQDLDRFLGEYTARILKTRDLPAVAQAFQFASRFQLRELVAFDQELGRDGMTDEFSRVSRLVGRTQLRRLRPLRSERFVQRYWKAVEDGEANAWHSVVFGLVLALYSLPLRQGLVHFARQTTGGFVEAAGLRIPLSLPERERLLTAHVGNAVAALESIVLETPAPVQ